MTTSQTYHRIRRKPLSGLFHKEKSTSIESKLTLAIRDVTGQSTQLFAAVKTEPGVHATHQIVSFQLEKESFSDNTELLKMKLNAALPADIAVTSLEIADERFVASLAVKAVPIPAGSPQILLQHYFPVRTPVL